MPGREGEININKISLPLVSVIIVNYSYGRFLTLTADSILSAGKIVTEAATFAPALGLFNFIVWLVPLKAAPHVILKGLPQAHEEERS